MGKKSWFSAMKKAVSPCIPMGKKKKRSHKSKSNPKNSRLANQMSLGTCSSTLANPFHHHHSMVEFKLPENEQIKRVNTITYVASQDKTKEEISAIKIQKDFRGYLARRIFRSLRAMKRLNLWIKGQAVKHQTATTLTRMQTMGRIRSQVRSRGIQMAQANETLQRHLIRKRKKALYKQAFDLSPKSKEQIDAISRSKKEAAVRREKALAYAYTRQQTWRNSQKSSFVEPNHLEWGWSWSHRWDAIRPWETTNTKALSRSKSANSKAMNPNSNISKLGRSPLA
ncbi:hypothetical protein R6Q57_013417 [Mikania cordata]